MVVEGLLQKLSGAGLHRRSRRYLADYRLEALNLSFNKSRLLYLVEWLTVTVSKTIPECCKSVFAMLEEYLPISIPSPHGVLTIVLFGNGAAATKFSH
jgi:hypothetical protein